MPSHVNLDALILREDFAVQGTEKQPEKSTMSLTELEGSQLFFMGLRKPDFQRETAEWSPQRVVGLIKTFIEGDLIPAVILWQHEGLLFVIDGSHRLSSLISWVHDDYGDGAHSLKFFDNMIPGEQKRLADQTRKLVDREFGSYQKHLAAGRNPESYDPDTVNRARRLAYRTLTLQWMSGDAKKAEAAFIRINQQAAVIQPQELKVIESRRKPGTIAARAIIRQGTGHKYWSGFEEAKQREVAALATDLHQMLFSPTLVYPIKSDDVPAGGGVYAATALPMVFDFVDLCNGTGGAAEDDIDGTRTVAYLTRCRRVMQLLLSNHPSSLGLHPAVYFYSWTGKQQPILFLAFAAIVIELEQKHRLRAFIDIREKLERFLIDNRSLINQVVRKFGTKKSGNKQLRAFYEDVLRLLWEGKAVEQLAESLKLRYTFLQPDEKPYEGQPGGKMSTKVKSGVVMKEFLLGAPRCGICKGFIPSQAISVDHRERQADGGSSAASNAQLTHPYCNSSIKESATARARKTVGSS